MKCANCDAPIERDVIRLERTYFRNCGDRDEKVVDRIVTVCSWSCAQRAAAAIEAGYISLIPKPLPCPGSGARVHESNVTNEGEVMCPVCGSWQPIVSSALLIGTHPARRNAAASGTF